MAKQPGFLGRTVGVLQGAYWLNRLHHVFWLEAARLAGASLLSRDRETLSDEKNGQIK